MKTLLLAFIIAFAITYIAGKILLPFLKRLKANQPILHYVEEHKQKAGTPTMGGLFFIIGSIATFFILSKEFNKTAYLAVAIMAGYAIIGFLDDFIKIKYKDNKGLTAQQKIIFQFAIAIIIGVFVFKSGQTFLLPVVNIEVDLKVFTVFVVAVVFLATVNGVNLTDGLDGLCAGSTFFYALIFCGLLIFGSQNLTLQGRTFLAKDYDALALLSVAVAGSLLAYLLFNVSKAKVFMGDTGSLMLGGFCASLGVFTEFIFFIPFLGIVFLISCISVILQVAHFKRTKNRIFLMAPYHHHLQMKGKTETQIMFTYIALTVITSFAVIVLTF